MERRTFLALAPGVLAVRDSRTVHTRRTRGLRVGSGRSHVFVLDRSMSSWQILIRLQAGECQ
jgi:hypothetical protein